MPKAKKAPPAEAKDPSGPSAGTSRALAGILGISPGTVTRLRQQAGFPVGRDPPWSSGDVAEIIAFRAFLQEDRANASREKAKPPPAPVDAEPDASPQDSSARNEPTTVELSKRLLIAKTEEAEFKAKSADLKWRKDAGLLVPRDQMDLSLEAMARWFKAELQATETRLVASLPGDQGVVRMAVEEEFGRMFDRMQECKEIALDNASEVDREL